MQGNGIKKHGVMESLDKYVDLKYDIRGSNFNKLEFEIIIFLHKWQGRLIDYHIVAWGSNFIWAFNS